MLLRDNLNLEIARSYKTVNHCYRTNRTALTIARQVTQVDHRGQCHHPSPLPSIRQDIAPIDMC